MSYQRDPPLILLCHDSLHSYGSGRCVCVERLLKPDNHSGMCKHQKQRAAQTQKLISQAAGWPGTEIREYEITDLISSSLV